MATSFQYFSKLPRALRCAVWSTAMKEPRFVFITEQHVDAPQSSIKIDNKLHEQLPSLFFVNRESRQQALAFYTIRFSVTHGPRHFLMAPTDVIAFDSTVASNTQLGFAGDTHLIRNLLFSFDLNRTLSWYFNFIELPGCQKFEPRNKEAWKKEQMNRYIMNRVFETITWAIPALRNFEHFEKVTFLYETDSASRVGYFKYEDLCPLSRIYRIREALDNATPQSGPVDKFMWKYVKGCFENKNPELAVAELKGSNEDRGDTFSLPKSSSFLNVLPGRFIEVDS
ncbi:hypothetical protein F5B20DRAFT_585235 [Whalleya microplaca]|nr:hypothetical protein F5B20DRAFT_585235 [Whalleya microplaca]